MVDFLLLQLLFNDLSLVSDLHSEIEHLLTRSIIWIKIDLVPIMQFTQLKEPLVGSSRLSNQDVNVLTLFMDTSGPLFVYFRPFLIKILTIQIEKSVDDVLGIRTGGCRLVVADETTELWRPPHCIC